MHYDGCIAFHVHEALKFSATREEIIVTICVAILFAPFSISIIAFIKIISFVLFTSIILWYYLTKGGNCTVIGIILILTYIVFQIVVS